MRRKPRQERSRAMVGSLIDATALAIAQHGLEGVNTVKIAEKAGVSVGSLYQYFDSKEDLYEGVLEQINIGLLAIVNAQIEQLADKSLRVFIHDLLDQVWQFLEANDQRYLHIVKYWAQLDFVRFMNELQNRLTTAFAVYLMHHPSATPVTEVPAKIYVLINSVLFTIVRHVSDPSPHISRTQIIEVFSQLAENILGAEATPRKA